MVKLYQVVPSRTKSYQVVPMEKRDSTRTTFDFKVDCQKNTLEEVLEFMRTEGLLKKWVFQKDNGGGVEHYKCKISLNKSEFTRCGRLRLHQMQTKIDEHLLGAYSIKVSRHPGQWDYITKRKTRTGGPWASPEDPTDHILRVPKVFIEPTQAGAKEEMDLPSPSTLISKVDDTNIMADSSPPVLGMVIPARSPKKVVISAKKRSHRDETEKTVPYTEFPLYRESSRNLKKSRILIKGKSPIFGAKKATVVKDATVGYGEGVAIKCVIEIVV